MTRRRVKEHNESVTDASLIIEIKDIDVNEILKTSRKMKKKFRLMEQSRRDTNNNGSASALESPNHSVNNTTFTLSRDYMTPEYDSPALEAKRKEIYDELNQSVTLRKNARLPMRTNDGTPVAVKTKATSSMTPHSPRNDNQRPRRRLANVKKQDDDPRVSLPKPEPSITFDNLNTDDESENSDDEDALMKYPEWAKLTNSCRRLQSKINSDVVDFFFSSNQVHNFNPEDLFPSTSSEIFLRRRSSLWE